MEELTDSEKEAASLSPTEHLRALVHGTPIVLFAVDARGVFTYTEGLGLASIGRTPDELIGGSVFELYAETPWALETIRRALAGEAVDTTGEVDGVWYHVQCVPIRGEAGEVSGVAGLAVDVTAKRRVEEALRASEERFRALAEGALEGVAVHEEGKILFANAALARMLGYSLDELVGRSALDLAAPESRERVREAIRTGSEESYVAVGLRKDGSTFEGELRGRTLRGFGRALRVVAIRDLTERRRAERELERSVSLLRASLESTADGILAVDREGRMTVWNRRFAEMWRLPEDLLQAHDDDRALAFVLEQLVEPERFLSRVRELYAHPERETFDVIELKDGRVFERYSRPQRLGDTFVGRVWSFRDVTWRRRAEEERDRVLRGAAFLADASRLLAGTLDYEASLPELARLAVPLLGDWCAIDEHRADGSVQRLAAVPGERPGAVAATCRVPLVVDGRLVGAVSFACTRDPGRYRGRDLAMIEDLAQRMAQAIDRARLVRETQAAVRVRDEFLSVASHELYTPVTSLLLTLQTLGDDAPVAPAVRARLLAIAERQVRRLTGLVGTLLDVSRIQTGRMTLDLEEVDLAALTGEVLARMEPDASRARCEVRAALGAPVVGRWDRSRLEQVVTNLLTNAFKYGAGRPVEVAVAATDRAARLTVRDHGIGIAPEQLPVVFRRFGRAVSPRHYGGLGLGLFICHEIVTAHGGTISVDSQVGEGSTFIVELPRAGPAPKEGGRDDGGDRATARR